MAKSTETLNLNNLHRQQAAPAPKRWRIDFDLHTLTMLHLGSGEYSLLADHEIAEGADASVKPFAATLARDVGGHPYLPGASLKGVLRQRAVAMGMPASTRDRLFGQVRLPALDDPCTTEPGLAEFRGARWKASPTSMNKTLEVRIAIERSTLTVADGKLFHEETTQPGTSFTASIFLPRAVAEDVAWLHRLLDGCTKGEPLCLGAHTRAGWGRIEVKQLRLSTVSAQALQQWWQTPLAADGKAADCPMSVFDPRDLPKLPEVRGTEAPLALDISLQFDAPFAVRDPAHHKGNNPDLPDAKPRQRNKLPLLPATSFLGALRSHAERILRTLGVTVPQGHAAKAVRTGDVPDDLVSLLFGCAGWRGLLGAQKEFITDEPAEPKSHHMVALCRVTGGGQDGAKFHFQCYESPLLKGKLVLDHHRLAKLHGRQTVLAPALGLLHLVLADLAHGDIGFGMARNKGWGWVKPDPDVQSLPSRAETTWWAELAPLVAGAAVPPALVAPELIAALHRHVAPVPALGASSPPTLDAAYPDSPPAQSQPPTLYRGPGKRGDRFHNPYHFLPFAQLHRTPADPPPEPADVPDVPGQASAGGHGHDRYHAGRHSGSLVVTLETVTPLYVGGALVRSTDPKVVNTSKAFTYQGQRAIPGTSLRGMLSALIEPMSGSAMRVIDADRTLSVRAPAEEGLPRFGVVKTKTDEEGEYLVVREKDGIEWDIDPDAATMLYALADERWKAKGEKLRLDGGGPPPKLYVKRRDRVKADGTDYPAKKGEVDLLPAIDWDNEDRFVQPRNDEPEKLGTRARLMTGQEVWFRLDDGEQHMVEIAWSGLYRQSRWIGDFADPGPLTLKRLLLHNGRGKHLPLGHRPDPHLHAAEWLLGAVEQRPKIANARKGLAWTFAGKLSVGIARSVTPPKTWGEVVLKELSSPKPPSPSLYLRPVTGPQERIGKTDLIVNPAAYDMQGTKVYLHALRDAAGVNVEKLTKIGLPGIGVGAELPWKSQRRAEEQSNRQIKVEPISRGENFAFTIRFTNLSTDELALLCAAIRPSVNFEHRLGMGRPLGLGSVRLGFKSLHIIDRAQRLADGSAALLPWDAAALAKLGIQTLHQRDPDLWRALLLLGEPRRIVKPVHYPQLGGQEIETRNYRWWVENDQLQGLQHQELDPIKEHLAKVAAGHQ